MNPFSPGHGTPSAFDGFRQTLTDEAARNRIEADAASLIVTAHAPYLKLTDVVVNHPLSELHSLRRTLTLRGESRPAALWANTHGAVVTAYVALNREMPDAGSLRPWLMGTWLARAVFRLKTDLPPVLFRPIPMKEDDRREHNLPPECARYLHMGDHDPLQSREGQPPPEFYVDADLLARIDRATRDSGRQGASGPARVRFHRGRRHRCGHTGGHGGSS